MNNNLNKWYPACCKHFTFYYHSYFYFITCIIRTFKKMPEEWFTLFKFYCLSYILLNTLLIGIYKNYKRCSVDKYCFPIVYSVPMCGCVGGFVWKQTYTQCLVICFLDSAHIKNCSNDFTIWLLFHKMSYSVCSTASASCSKALLTVHLLFSIFSTSCVNCNLMHS